MNDNRLVAFEGELDDDEYTPKMVRFDGHDDELFHLKEIEAIKPPLFSSFYHAKNVEGEFVRDDKFFYHARASDSGVWVAGLTPIPMMWAPCFLDEPGMGTTLHRAEDLIRGVKATAQALATKSGDKDSKLKAMKKRILQACSGQGDTHLFCPAQVYQEMEAGGSTSEAIGHILRSLLQPKTRSIHKPNVFITLQLMQMVKSLAFLGPDQTKPKAKPAGEARAAKTKQPTLNPSIPPGCKKAVDAFNALYPTMSLTSMIKEGNITLKDVTVGGRGDCTSFGLIGRCSATCPYNHNVCTPIAERTIVVEETCTALVWGSIVLLFYC